MTEVIESVPHVRNDEEFGGLYHGGHTPHTSRTVRGSGFCVRFPYHTEPLVELTVNASNSGLAQITVRIEPTVVAIGKSAYAHGNVHVILYQLDVSIEQQ